MILLIGGCGYIGSELGPFLTQHGYQVDNIDQELFGNPAGLKNQRRDYRTLSRDELAKYDTVIVLAAHSSVQMAMRDPSAAFGNNIAGFAELLDKLDAQTLLYASSSSVYSGVAGNPVDESWASFSVGNIYDFSKYANDCLAGFSGKRTLGLRFGTVNGPSPNLRTDIMINKMVLTGLRDGKVCIANPGVYRPILALADLCRAVLALLQTPDTRGVYNLASFNATVSEIGHAIAGLLSVPILALPDSPTYDFSMQTGRIERECGFKFTQTLPSIVRALQAHYQVAGLAEHGR